MSKKLLNACASEQPNLETIEQLLKNGADVNTVNNQGNTPLHLICLNSNSLPAIQLLIRYGANVDKKNNKQSTALFYASYRTCDPEVIKCLVTNGANVDEKNGDGNTPLNNACARKKGGYVIIKILLELGANINIQNDLCNTPLHELFKIENSFDSIKLLVSTAVNIKELLNTGDINGNTPLHLASYHQNPEVVQYLIDMGADVNAKNQKGNTPFIEAILGNNKEVIAMFLKLGVDPKIINSEGKNVLHFLSSSCHNPELTEFFLGKGVDVNTEDNDGYTPLNTACQNQKDADYIRLLLDYGANVKTKSHGGTTPLFSLCMNSTLSTIKLLYEHHDLTTIAEFETALLHAACMNKNSDTEDIVGFLIAKNFAINTLNQDGETPLHIACRYGRRRSVLKKLLKNGANPNALNKSGETPIFEVQHNNDPYKILARYGADLNVKNANGETPLQILCRRGCKSTLLNLFIEKKADPLVKDDQENNLLHIVCDSENGEKVVDVLIKNGVGINDKNEDNDTPLIVACRSYYCISSKKKARIIKLLLDRGADIHIEDDSGESTLSFMQRHKSEFKKIVKWIDDK